MKVRRIAETADAIFNWAKNLRGGQVRFNTLGEGYYFFSGPDNTIQRMITPPLCRPATDTEINELHKWLDRDMVQLEQRVCGQWRAVHQPKGFSFAK